MIETENRQFIDELKRDYLKSGTLMSWYNSHTELEFDVPAYLYVPKGRHKGKVGQIVNIHYHSNYILRFDDGKEQNYHYTKVLRVDQNKKPIEPAYKDMSGREIRIGDLVAYSTTNSRTASSTIGIGQIEGFTPSGQINMTIKIADGKPSEEHYRQQHRAKSPTMLLRLPIDKNDLTIWILGDFKNLKSQDDRE